MIFFDGHTDTLCRIADEKHDLYKNTLQLDINRLHKKGNSVQFFAAYISPEYYGAYALRRAIELIECFYSELEKYNNYMSLCLKYSDITNALKEGKTAALLSLESGDALQGRIYVLNVLYRLGVRSMCLTWNHRNELADGVFEQESGGGLTLFGRSVVKEMNNLGMLIDVSHLGEKGFWDVIECSEFPIAATHTNTKAICNHKRNLSDAQIKALASSGGMIGINIYPPHLSNTSKATISDVIAHIEHAISIGGEDCVGIGADFDLIEDTPDGINGTEDMYKLFDELYKLNYSQHIIEKIAGGNFLRLVGKVLK